MFFTVLFQKINSLIAILQVPMLNKIRICLLHTFKEYMLNLLKALEFDNYYFELRPTSLNDYHVKWSDTNITNSAKYTRGEIIYIKWLFNELENWEVLRIVAYTHVRYTILWNGNTKFKPYSIILNLDKRRTYDNRQWQFQETWTLFNHSHRWGFVISPKSSQSICPIRCRCACPLAWPRLQEHHALSEGTTCLIESWVINLNSMN